MDGGTPPSQRKRVHFSYDEPQPDEPRREKKPRFPKGKKENQRVERTLEFIEGEEGDGPIKSTDPRVAATERAVRRTQYDEQLRVLEDTSLPNDVLGAEEEYQSEDSYEREEDGICLEPFNLKQEREEGFFDADGNYVEYRNYNDVKDAWLDNVEVDTSVAEKHMKQYAEEEVERDLSSKELAEIKRRVADALLPEETVLQALRRLKETSTERDRHAKARMSSSAKAAFDRLTEDAMKLLDQGDYNVYHEKKETFQREAEGYESLTKARLGLSSSGVLGETSTRGEIMFASDGNGASQLLGSVPEMGVASADTVGTVFGGLSNTLSRNLAEPSTDMFADDDEVGNSGNDPDAPQGKTFGEDSGYVYDESTGYYYSSTLGYYYDSSSGLFCNAASGTWFRFDEESNAYVEVVAEKVDEYG